MTTGTNGTGWLQIEIVLVRLNQAYAPNSTFGAYARPNPGSDLASVGYDVAVCVEEFKPYVVDAYNTVSLWMWFVVCGGG
jgi:hypothetical protein